MAEALIVACPHCNTLNRAPPDKLAAGASGKCGHCGSPLFDGQPPALTAPRLETHAVKSAIPLRVDFGAPWGGPCQAMARKFEQAAGKLEPTVRLAKINTDQEPELASRFRIQGIPTVILFKKGREIARQSGVMDARGLTHWVQQELS